MIEDINERDEDKGLRMSQWDICGSPGGGLIRSTGPLIYAIVNPVKLCHKYRLMPPLRPADVITVESALHNFRSPSSVALFSVFLFFVSRSRGTCPSFRCIFRVPSSGGAAFTTRIARSFLFLLARAARTSARPKFRITLSLSLFLFPPIVGLTLSRFKSITHS